MEDSGPPEKKPLHVAGSSGHVEVVKMLPEKGAMKEAVDTVDYMLMHLPALRGNVEVVKIILKKGSHERSWR